MRDQRRALWRSGEEDLGDVGVAVGDDLLARALHGLALAAARAVLVLHEHHLSLDPFSWRSCVMSHSPSTASGSQTFSTFSSTSLSLSFAPFASRSVDASRLSTLATSWHTWHRMYFTSDLTARSSSGSFFFFFSRRVGARGQANEEDDGDEEE